MKYTAAFLLILLLGCNAPQAPIKETIQQDESDYKSIGPIIRTDTCFYTYVERKSGVYLCISKDSGKTWVIAEQVLGQAEWRMIDTSTIISQSGNGNTQNITIVK